MHPSSLTLKATAADHRSAGRHLLDGLTWRRVGYTFVVAAGLALWTGPGSWMLDKSGWHPKLEIVAIRDFLVDHSWGWVFVFIVYLPVLISQMLALTVADNLRITRVPRGPVLVIALLLGTTVGSAIVVSLTNDFFGVVAGRGLAWGGLIALVYFKHRRDAELAAALHDAQLASMEQQKEALESDLQLMQAQIEPQFLFNTLQRIRDLYETDPASADRMLENLILYLRAVLPQMRASNSTLGQEVRLVRAYLNIESIGEHARPDFAFDIPEPLVSSAFPPMVLLPLIEAIAPHRGPADRGRSSLRAAARVDARVLTVTFMHDSDVLPDTDSIGTIRDRLTALFGAEGRLDFDRLARQGTFVTLAIPHVPA
jgi:LytS/YehU family sensor histidine kinase